MFLEPGAGRHPWSRSLDAARPGFDQKHASPAAKAGRGDGSASSSQTAIMLLPVDPFESRDTTPAFDLRDCDPPTAEENTLLSSAPCDTPAVASPVPDGGWACDDPRTAPMLP